MLKLIIADDEYRVCQLIEQLIPWEELAIELSGTAYDGIEAFRLIQEVRPDIVVTDIRMPGYDGLTLIEKSKLIDSNISFILVSGHRDFEYAHNALKYGAEDYLLKPLSGEELLRIVSKVVERKIQLADKENNERTIKNELHKSKETLKIQLAKDLILKRCIIDQNILPVIEKDYLVSFDTPYFQTIIIHVDHLGKIKDIENYRIIENILEKAKRLTVKFIEERVGEFLHGIQGSSLVYLLNMKGHEGLNLRDVERLYEDTAQKLSEYGEWKVTICLGDSVTGIENLHKSFEDAVFAKSDRIFQGIGKVIEKRNLTDKEKEIPDYKFSELKEKLRELLELEDELQMRKYLEVFYTLSLVSNRVSNPYHVQLLCREMTEVVLTQLQNLGADRDSIESAREKSEKVIEWSYNTKLLGEQLIKLLIVITTETLSSRKVQNYKPIRIAKEYIKAHYTEAINLQSVAKEAGFNPIYLSALFKKETGINFKDYLVRKRIEKAKDLLLSSNDTIQSIGDQVGYKDVRHFSKLFTKSVGLTPNEYRKIYG